MVSSPKPLPTHKGLLRPDEGSKGPNAAGLAKKNVELSSVRLMMAEGGNSVTGDVKEKRDLSLLCLGADMGARISCSSLEPKETYRRSVRATRLQASDRRRRNGRMVGGGRRRTRDETAKCWSSGVNCAFGSNGEDSAQRVDM
jgi:hypothetical protein